MLQPMRHIGSLLAERRVQLNLTQHELAERMGKSQSAIARVENGKRDPRWATVLEFARALELEPALIPRDKRAAVDAVLRLSSSDDVPPLAGEHW